MIDHAQQQILEQLTEACAVFIKFFYDDKVEEISVNPDGKILIFTTDRGKLIQEERLDSGTANTIMNLVSSFNHIDLTKTFLMETQFPLNGGRFSGTVAPYSQPGAKTEDSTSAGSNMPSFSIRCGGKKIYEVPQLLASGMIEEEVVQHFHDIITQRKNIMVSGGTKSGKTALLNTLLLLATELTPNDRVVIITDIDDVICYSEDSMVLFAQAPLTMKDMTIHSLRRSPERIVFGEVRGGEALLAIVGWSTGHSGGLLTIHATDATKAPKRLRRACRMDNPDTDKHEISEAIVDAVDVVVFVKESRDVAAGRRVTEIAEINGYDSETDTFQIDHIYKYDKK